MNPRRHLNLHVGNVAQLSGVGLACDGIWRIAGLGVALVVAGAFLVALANLEWDATVLRLPLPGDHRPHWAKGALRSRLAARLRRLGHAIALRVKTRMA